MDIPTGRYVGVGLLLVVGAGLATLRPAGMASAAPPEAEVKAEAKGDKEKKSGGGFSFSFGGKSGPRRVEVLKPRRGPVATSIQAPGTVRAGSEAGIGAPFEGKVIELRKDEGQPVEEGEVIFRLDPQEREEAVLEAEIDLARKRASLAESEVELADAERKRAELDEEPTEVTEARLRVRQSELQAQRAKAQLEAAQAALARAQSMLTQGIGREVDVESAETEQRVSLISVRIAEEELALARETLSFRERTWKDQRNDSEKTLRVTRQRTERARSDLQGAELALKRAQRDLDRTRIRSPLTGTITGRGVNLGDEVTRATGDTTHYIISDLSRMVVYADVDEGDVVKVAVAQPSVVHVNALGDANLEGQVYDVGYRAQTAQGDEVPTFRVRVLIRPGQEGGKLLRPGMTANVEIETARVADALKVPLQAVLQRERNELSDDLVEAIPAGLREGVTDLLTGPEDDLLDVVYAVVDGKVQGRLVRLGLHDDDEVQILGGLEDDARVVVGPFRTLDKLSHGQAVKAEDSEVTLPPDEETADTAAVDSSDG